MIRAASQAATAVASPMIAAASRQPSPYSARRPPPLNIPMPRPIRWPARFISSCASRTSSRASLPICSDRCRHRPGRAGPGTPRTVCRPSSTSARTGAPSGSDPGRSTTPAPGTAAAPHRRTRPGHPHPTGRHGTGPHRAAGNPTPPIRAVILPDRPPLPLTHIRPPQIPVAGLPQPVLQPPEPSHPIPFGAHRSPLRLALRPCSGSHESDDSAAAGDLSSPPCRFHLGGTHGRTGRGQATGLARAGPDQRSDVECNSTMTLRSFSHSQSRSGRLGACLPGCRIGGPASAGVATVGGRRRR